VIWSGMLRAVQESGPGAGEPDLRGMLMREIADGREIDLQIMGYGKVVHLPQWPPLQLGPLTIDLSPTKHVVFVVLSAVVLLAVFIPIGRAMRRRPRSSTPRGFSAAMEALVLFFRDEVVRRNVGRDGEAYTPYIITLFFFVLVMNLTGLVPFGATPTGNLSVTGALALVSFLVVELSGIRELGLSGYVRTILHAPPGMGRSGRALLLLILTPVELLGKVTKPFALMIRLFANMIAGHTLVLSLLGMIFLFAYLPFGKWAVAGASVATVSAFLVLEVFVAFLQAYIFTMLTAVFIGLVRRVH